MIGVNGRFGIKYVIPYKLGSKDPYGIFRVMQELTVERAREGVNLTGGNPDGAWAQEAGEPANPLSLVLREYPDFAFTTFEEGTQVDNTAAEPSGNFGTIENTLGTSIFDATTGIASIAAKVGKEANIPFGRLVIKGTAVAGEVDIYLVGTPKGDGAFLNDLGLVAQGVTIPGTGGTVDVDELGITITGGSGAIAFTDGDVAVLDVRGANFGSVITTVGSKPNVKNMGIMAVLPELSDGSLTYIDFHKVSVPSGIPFTGIYREWAEFTLTGEVLVDPCNANNLYTLYRIKPEDICS
jgi:hypothetical protein